MLSGSEVRSYRKQCPYCKSWFYFHNPQANRVTCGQLACRKTHSLFLAKKNHRAKTGLQDKVKKCLYCKRKFTCLGDRQVTCGQYPCRKAHIVLSRRLKKGLKEQVKKCLYCQRKFITASDRQVTCGRPACKVKQSTATQYKRLSIEKTCRFCGKVFKALRRTKYQSDRRRVACGKIECQKARRRSYPKKPVSKELTAHYWQRHKAKLAIIKELESLAGIERNGGML